MIPSLLDELGETGTATLKQARLLVHSANALIDEENRARFKATLVNLSQVKEIVPWFGGRFKLVMRGGENGEVIVSRAQARELRQRLRW